MSPLLKTDSSIWYYIYGKVAPCELRSTTYIGYLNFTGFRQTQFMLQLLFAVVALDLLSIFHLQKQGKFTKFIKTKCSLSFLKYTAFLNVMY